MSYKKIQTILFIMITCGCMFSGCSNSKSSIKAGDTQLPKLTLLNHNKIMKDLLGEPKINIKKIGILVYNGCHAMEAIGSMAVFSEMMDVDLRYVGLNKGLVKTDVAEIYVDNTIADITSLDLLIIPGGDKEGMNVVLTNENLKRWIQKIDGTTKLTAGIGYGSLVLGNAGVLKGKKIAMDGYEANHNAKKTEAKWIDKRYHNDGKYWTSVGQTASLDLGLAMLNAITGEKHTQAAMLDLEYDPQPPVKGGTIALTPKNILDIAKENAYTIGNFHLINDTRFNQKNKTLATAGGNHSVKRIGILAYEGFFTLDAIGPLVVLSQIPGVKVQFIGKDIGKLKTGRTYLNIKNKMNDPQGWDMILVPGGAASTVKASQDTMILNWLKEQDTRTDYIASVCTGSWILGNAGLLKGKKATSNWYRVEERLNDYGAKYVKDRYANDGKYWTSAGVSAGIDISFALMKEWLGNDFTRYALLQLAYHPQPPIRGGVPEKTDPLVLDMMMQMYDYGMLPLLKKDKNKANNHSKTEHHSH